MAHDASHNPSVSGVDPLDRPAGGMARYDGRTILLLVFGVLLFALGHPTKGAEVARILGRLRKRHLDLIVGRVMDGLRLAEELDRRDAEQRAAAASAGNANPAETTETTETVSRGEVVRFSVQRRLGPVDRPKVRRDGFARNVSRGPPPWMALAA